MRVLSSAIQYQSLISLYISHCKGTDKPNSDLLAVTLTLILTLRQMLGVFQQEQILEGYFEKYLLPAIMEFPFCS